MSAVLVGNSLLKLANTAVAALIGFYLADLARQGRAIDAALVGMLALVANGVELTGALPAGRLADRISPRTLLVAAASIGALATLLFGITGLIPIFFVSRALEGVAAAISSPTILAYLADLTQDASPATRGRTTSLFELSLLVGLSTGTLVGGLAWDWLAEGAFALLAVAYLGAAALFLSGTRSLPETAGNHLERPAPMSQLLSRPGLLRLAPAWLMANAIAGLWLTHAIFQLSGPSVPGQYLVGRFGAATLAWLSLAYAMLFGLGILIWGRLLARVAPQQVMRISLGGVLVASLTFYLINLSEGWPTVMRVIVICFYAVAVLVQSGFAPAALAYLLESAADQNGRGVAMGLYTLLLGLGTVLGAVIGGVLAKELYMNGLLVGTAVLAVAGLLSTSMVPATHGTSSRQ